MTTCLYAVINKVNWMFYIGSAKDLSKRYSSIRIDESVYDWTQHHNEHLAYAAKKYGNKNFVYTLISKHDTIEEALFIEQMWFDYLCTFNNYWHLCYNISKKATGGNLGEEVNEKFRGKNNPFYGKKHTEKTRKKISETVKAEMRKPDVWKKFIENNSSLRTRAKRSASINKPEIKKKIGDASKKNWQDAEFRKKQSLVRKLRWTSDEQKEQSKKTRGENNGRAKLTREQVLEIRRLATTEIYTSMSMHKRNILLSKIYGVGPGAIHDIITQRRWKHL